MSKKKEVEAALEGVLPKVTGPGHKTEKEMRDEEAPCPNTTDELLSYVKSLTDRPHDYGTCVYAMSLAATAAFQHVAHVLGVTGFQASCADLDIIRRTRGWEGPFILLKAEDMLYPQYDIPGKLVEALNEWRDWAAEEAKKKIAEGPAEGVVAGPVRQRWHDLADKKLTWVLGNSLVNKGKAKPRKKGGKECKVNISIRNFDGRKTGVP